MSGAESPDTKSIVQVRGTSSSFYSLVSDPTDTCYLCAIRISRGEDDSVILSHNGMFNLVSHP